MRKAVLAAVLVVGVHLGIAPLLVAQQQGTLAEQIWKSNDELFHKGNLDLADEISSPNYVVHVDGGQTQVGPQAIRDFVTAMRTAFPDLHVEIEVLLEKGNKVAWLRTHRGTFKSDFLGQRATGKNISWREMVVTRYQDGLIAEEWAVSDFSEAVGRAE